MTLVNNIFSVSFFKLFITFVQVVHGLLPSYVEKAFATYISFGTFADEN